MPNKDNKIFVKNSFFKLKNKKSLKPILCVPHSGTEIPPYDEETSFLPRIELTRNEPLKEEELKILKQNSINDELILVYRSVI